MPLLGRYTTSRAKVIELEKPPLWPEGLTPLPADEVEIAVLNQVGARPWDRDYHDARLVADVAEGRGWIIDSQEDVHGYPKEKPTRRQFNPERLGPRDHAAAAARGTGQRVQEQDVNGSIVRMTARHQGARPL